MNHTDRPHGDRGEDTAAAEFKALLPPGRTVPLELGMTAILRAICPGEITADIQVTQQFPLAADRLGLSEEQMKALKAGPREPAWLRTGYLIDAVTRRHVVRTSAVVLLRRVPWTCRKPLGLSASTGSPVAGRTTTSLAAALRQRNVSRVQLATDLTPGHADAHGNSEVLRSQAILQTLKPIALVTEFVYEELLATYPPASWSASPVLKILADRPRPA